MSVETIVRAVLEGDLTTASAELTVELNSRRDDLIEQGRQFIASSIQEGSADVNAE